MGGDVVGDRRRRERQAPGEPDRGRVAALRRRAGAPAAARIAEAEPRRLGAQHAAVPLQPRREPGLRLALEQGDDRGGVERVVRAERSAARRAPSRRLQARPARRPPEPAGLAEQRELQARRQLGRRLQLRRPLGDPGRGARGRRPPLRRAAAASARSPAPRPWPGRCAARRGGRAGSPSAAPARRRPRSPRRRRANSRAGTSAELRRAMPSREFTIRQRPRDFGPRAAAARQAPADERLHRNQCAGRACGRPAAWRAASGRRHPGQPGRPPTRRRR